MKSKFCKSYAESGSEPEPLPASLRLRRNKYGLSPTAKAASTASGRLVSPAPLQSEDVVWFTDSDTSNRELS